MNSTTILIDGFNGDKITKAVEYVKENHNNDIIVMKRVNDACTHSYLEAEPHYISSDTRLGALYQAKIRIDSTMSTDVVLICSENQANFWFTVCRELLTPAYSFKLQLPNNAQPVYDETVVPEIENFLSSYVTKDDVTILRSNIIDESLFYHGFSTRKGGLSTARGVASLNLTPASIKRDTDLIGNGNVRRLAAKGGFLPETFVRARAVHGNTVYVVGEDEPKDGYDCLISNQTNLTIAAPGADCVMMLFADPVNFAFGACHSGWKGTLAKACIATIEKMQEKYDTKSENIRVALGPCIGPCCLEFDSKDAVLFESINEKSVIWREGHEKPFVNLRLVNRSLLESVGVLPSHIDDTSVTLCTSCNPDLLFSYRRDKIPFGNQVGYIGRK